MGFDSIHRFFLNLSCNQIINYFLVRINSYYCYKDVFSSNIHSCQWNLTLIWLTLSLCHCEGQQCGAIKVIIHKARIMSRKIRSGGCAYDAVTFLIILVTITPRWQRKQHRWLWQWQKTITSARTFIITAIMCERYELSTSRLLAYCCRTTEGKIIWRHNGVTFHWFSCMCVGAIVIVKINQSCQHG